MSNFIVIHYLKKFLLISVAVVCALLLLVLVASQVGQHIFRRRAELLLAQMQSLELGKTSWQDAQSQLKGWARETKLDDRCDETECFEAITLAEPVSGFIFPMFEKMDDYLRWRFRLSFNRGPFARMAQQVLFPGYMMMGGRPARIVATVGMRDGAVQSKEFDVDIETYRHFDSGSWGEYILAADMRGVPQLDLSKQFVFNPHDPQVILHPSYFIGRPGGCEICIMVYVYFTPGADPADVHRLQPDLSCLTRIHPCLDEIDIMPAAWKQHLEERPQK